ncbi:MAG: alpha-amylase family glycosyl hydrolase [bacterium]|nr:alpha-amylase family glycosyl hydrolase [bacterium]
MPSYSGKQVVYQVNTWVWVTDLTRTYGRPIDLGSIPDSALDQLARPGVDAIWLMGIWQRSPFGRRNAQRYKQQYRAALPDLTDDDIIGSAYAIYDYRVDDGLGGRSALAALRTRLAARGLRLILDYVPNHLAADHDWTITHPEWLIQGRPGDLETRKSDFFKAATLSGDRIFAHGKDPNFPGWEDTVQVNAFHPELRAEVVRTLLDIAAQCDGVRCDMAMLMFNDIFASTWYGYLTHKPGTEFWREVIPNVKAQHPDFLFIAEVYWDKEYETIQQGFDYAYDKTFYDRIVRGEVAQIRQHLLAAMDYQRHMIRFIENHDEPRAYSTLGPKRSFPAATLITTLPGATLLHEGQLSGRTVKLPVQIKRWPDEPLHPGLELYYQRLLREVRHPLYHEGNFFLFHVNSSGGGDPSHHNLLAYGWYIHGQGFRLIVVNLTGQRSFGRIRLDAWRWLDGMTWRLYDVTDGAEYTRHGGELTQDGLFIDLEPYESHVFRFARSGEPITTAELSAAHPAASTPR